MNTTVAITGTDEVMRNLLLLAEKAPGLVADALELEAEAIFSESQKQVPWDTTHLRTSGTIEPFVEGNAAGYLVGYNAHAGASDYNYALRQHEDLTLHHPKPGTKGKYLEDPFNARAPMVAENVTNRVSGYFAAGTPIQFIGTLTARRKKALGNLAGRFL